MKIAWTTAFVLLLAPRPQVTGYRHGGTFIGAVIAEDGIVVGSDSRTTFLDGSGQAFAYVDGMPKIYVKDGPAVAMSGLTSLEGELFSSFVKRNDYLLARPVNEILFGFLVWLPFANSNGVGLLSAGFVDGKPMICAKAPILPQSCTSSGYFASKNSPLLRENLTKLGRLPRTGEAAAALKAAIEEYSRTDPTVGGPVSLLKLTRGAPAQWLENPATDNGWTRICQVVEEHRRGRIRIKPLGTQEDLDRHLDAACPR
jgi:hypothetical protein